MKTLNGRVGLVPEPIEEISSGGIILPNTPVHRVEEWMQYSTRARVVAVPDSAILDYMPVASVKPGDTDRGWADGQRFANVRIPNELRVGDLVTVKYMIWKDLTEMKLYMDEGDQRIYLAHYSQILFRHGEDGPEAIGPHVIGRSIIEEQKVSKSGLIESVDLYPETGICLVHSLGYDYTGSMGDVEVGMTIIHKWKSNFEMDYGDEEGEWQCLIFEDILAAIPEGYTVEEAYERLAKKREFEELLIAPIK